MRDILHVASIPVLDADLSESDMPIAVKADEFDCFFTNIVNKCISVGTFLFNSNETSGALEGML